MLMLSLSMSGLLVVIVAEASANCGAHETICLVCFSSTGARSAALRATIWETDTGAVWKMERNGFVRYDGQSLLSYELKPKGKKRHQQQGVWVMVQSKEIEKN